MKCLPPSAARAGALAVLAVLAPGLALAQTSDAYSSREAGSAYAEAPANATVLFTDSDDGLAEVALPFAFDFYGREYRKVWVSANGAVTLIGADPLSGAALPLPGQNLVLPSQVAPQAIIAAAWDDWVATPRAPEGGSRIAWFVEGTAPSRVFVVDWQRVQAYGDTGAAAPAYSFQLALFEGSDEYELRFGPRTGSRDAALSFSSASENHLGTLAYPHLACGAACTAEDALEGTGVRVFPNLNPELTIALAIAGAQGGGPLVDVSITNTGKSPVTSVGWRVRVSADTTLDAGDRIVLDGTTDLAADTGRFDRRAAVPMPLSEEGPRWLIAEVDFDNAVAELNKRDNVMVLGSPFVAGIDLAGGIRGTRTAVMGEKAAMTLQLRNLGVRDALGGRVRVTLAPEAGGADPITVLTTDPLNVPALATVERDVTFDVPTGLLAGPYLANILVDPDEVLDEVTRANNTADLPLGVELRGPDLVVTSVAAGSSRVPRGGSVPLRVGLANAGLARTGRFTFSVYLSDNDVITVRDLKIFDSSEVELVGAESRVVTEAVRIPATVAPGTYYLGVIADAQGRIEETERSNNVNRTIDLFTVTEPLADVTVLSVSVQPEAAAGEMARMSAVAANLGTAAATARYGVYVSDNDTISANDRMIGEGTVTLAPGGQASIARDVQLPSTLAAGTYWLGLVLDPDGALSEADETNNAVASDPFELSEAVLAVTTSALPAAVVGLPYDVRLAARGGDGAYSWRLAAGELPSGLSFDASGRFSGTPITPGVRALVVEAKSAGAVVLRSYTLAVQASAPSLGFLDSSLPPARRGVTYEQSIGVAGGTPPYRFSIAEGSLPAGLQLTADGILRGLPTLAGESTVTVAVEDAAGNRASTSLVAKVYGEAALQLVTSRLREAESGRAYSVAIPIDGGLAPYAVRTSAGALPEGISVALDAGGKAALLSGTSRALGAYSFQLEVTDSRGERDFANLALRVAASPLKLLTSSLPASSRGATYTATIESTAREGARYAIVDGELPAGLELDPAGTIAGRVSASAPARLYAFAVRVTDDTGAQGLGALAIDVPKPSLPVEAGGCSSTGSPGLFALGLVALLALARRRRLPLALAAAAVTLLAASPALAQYRVARTTETYVPLEEEGSEVVFDHATTARSEAVALPFTFLFHGTAQNTVGIGRYGILTFGGTSETSSNVKIPTGSDPNLFIAPFWDFLKLSALTPDGPSVVRTRVDGTAPDRVFAVEWRNMQKDSSSESGAEYSAFSFQVRLHEGSSSFSVHYGGRAALLGRTPALSGSMGIEGPGGLAGAELSDVPCSPSCTAAHIPVNAKLRFDLAADLSVAGFTAPDFLFANFPATVQATVRNRGGADARDVRVRILLSSDALADDGDTVIGESAALTILAGNTTSFATRVTAPVDGPTGLAWILAEVDPDDTVDEIVEDDNAATPSPVSVSPPAPDLAAARLVSTTLLAPGAPFKVTRTIRNVGNAAGGGSWKLVLSDNDIVSDADAALASGELAELAVGASVDATADVTLPARTPPGRYWLGLLVRPAAGAVELDAFNNDLSYGPVDVAGGALAVATEALPAITAGVQFSVQLAATGGRGAGTWSAGVPAPPAGVTVTSTGELKGRVDAPGEWPVQVRVESAGEVASRTFTLRASGEGLPLQLVTQRLPLALSGEPYTASFAALGGTPPYSWALAEGAALPQGLVLGTDGRLEGTTLADGRFTLATRVTDAKGATASGDVLLPIAGPSRPLVATTDLPPASVGAAYTATLVAAGGKPPYRFSVSDSRRLPSGFTPAQSFLGQLPPGLELAESGAITGTPTVAGLYTVTVRVTDAERDDSATFLLSIGAGGTATIVTSSLPDGVVLQPFTFDLRAAGFEGDVTWELELGDQTLPSGLAFTSAGRITGTPLAEGTVSFIAIARDASGRQAMRALGLRIVAAPVKVEESGCSQTGVSMWWFALVGLLALAARRTRRAGAAALAAGALLLGGGCTPTEANTSKCRTACAAPFVCDELDGLCKCGAAGGAVCTASETCDAATRSCLVATCDTPCPSGTTCGRDGLCHCGALDGAVCGAGEACGANGTCERVDACAGVTCAAGHWCDGAAQGACRCGDGAACEAGRRCVSGACVADLCEGVGCLGGTSCDPADGACKCGGAGGAVCRVGEACDAANATCVRSSRCDGVTCGAGEACDPADGACRCGGVGGPVCGEGQSCDPVARKCSGGDLCAGVSCSGNTSCDPEDGQCKCGGYAGVACTSNQICVVKATRQRCERACDPMAPACSTGQACRFDDEARVSYCEAAGTMRRGEPCSGSADCGARLHCRIASGSAQGVCRDYCESSDSCDVGQVCQQFATGSALGICIPNQ